MTPGIQPSKVRRMLRKKLASRPVISTATGGSTTQKKYRNAFIRFNKTSATDSHRFSQILFPTGLTKLFRTNLKNSVHSVQKNSRHPRNPRFYLFSARSLRSPVWKADRRPDVTIAVQ